MKKGFVMLTRKKDVNSWEAIIPPFDKERSELFEEWAAVKDNKYLAVLERGDNNSYDIHFYNRRGEVVYCLRDILMFIPLHERDLEPEDYYFLDHVIWRMVTMVAEKLNVDEIVYDDTRLRSPDAETYLTDWLKQMLKDAHETKMDKTLPKASI